MLPNHTVAPVNFAVGSKAAVVTVTIVATIEKKGEIAEALSSNLAGTNRKGPTQACQRKA